MTKAITVKSFAEACRHFQPFDRNRKTETVTIEDENGVSFLHWDPEKGKEGVFTRDDGQGNTSFFRGRLIDNMSKPALNPEPAPEGARLQ